MAPVTHPLNGIRILDLSRLLPGGYCTQLLADLGADVIKIETPLVGDYARLAPELFGGDQLFRLINRNKRSVAINFRNPRGREVLMRLVTGADALFETFRPGLVERWGINYESMRPINSRLVYCSLTGYGQGGPYADRAGHDINYAAISGLLAANGVADGPPAPIVAQVADLGGAMMAALSMVSALLGRNLTGEGAYLDISMLDSAVSWALPVLGPLYMSTGRAQARGEGPLSGGLPCYNIYRAADGAYLSLGALEPPLWTTFCRTAGRDDLIGRQWELAAIEEVAALFRTRTRDEWLDTFADAEVCLEPVGSFEEMLAHPQVSHRSVVDDVRDGSFTVGSSLGGPVIEASSAPSLGQHTAEVLGAAGFGDQELQELAASKTIKLG